MTLILPEFVVLLSACDSSGKVASLSGSSGYNDLADSSPCGGNKNIYSIQSEITELQSNFTS